MLAQLRHARIGEAWAKHIGQIKQSQIGQAQMGQSQIGQAHFGQVLLRQDHIGQAEIQNAYLSDLNCRFIFKVKNETKVFHFYVFLTDKNLQVIE